MIDPGAEAFLEQSIDKVGVDVVISRAFGYAPNVATFSVTLKAKVADAQANTTSPATDGISASTPGVVTQDDRVVILMAKHLTASRMPLPLRKGDLVTLPATLEDFTVSRVDPYLRAIAGAITLTVTGVA